MSSVRPSVPTPCLVRSVDTTTASPDSLSPLEQEVRELLEDIVAAYFRQYDDDDNNDDDYRVWDTKPDTFTALLDLLWH